MRLKIFSCHHRKPEFSCNTEVFQTLVLNGPAPADGSFLSGRGGVDIADNLCSELRHQFYVWKNLIEYYDYIGFEQARRVFFIDTLPAGQLASEFNDVWEMRLYFTAFRKAGLKRDSHDFLQYLAMRRSLDPAANEHLRQWVGNYDVIVPRPNDIEQRWKDEALWDTMVEGLNQSEVFRARPNAICLQMEVCYCDNMYIMRSDLLKEYLAFCFQVLAFCRSRLDLSGPAPGYVAEWLFSFWLYQKRIEVPTLRVLELPFVMLHPSPETKLNAYSFSPKKPA
jgi:hypothetical protein